MKIIVIFALIGACLCFGGDGDGGTWMPDNGGDKFVCKEEYKRHHFDAKDPRQCLQETLKGVPEMANAANAVICRYNHKTEDERKRLFKDFKSELSNVVNCTTCGIDNLLQTGDTVSNVGNPVGAAGGEAVDTVEGLLVRLGLSSTVDPIICYLTTQLLTSECLKKVLVKLQTNVAEIETLLCSAETLDIKKLVKFLGDSGCLVADILKLDENTSRKVVEDIGRTLVPFLKNLVIKLKEMPLTKPITSAGCKVIELVDGLIQGNNLDFLLNNLNVGSLTSGLLANLSLI